MFTWICEKCGRECQPNEAECPRCNPKPEEAPTIEMVRPVTPPSFGVAAAPPVAESNPAPAPAPKLEPTPKKKAGMPGWAAALLSFAAIGVVGGGAFFGLRYFQGQPAAAPEAAAPETARPTPAVVATRNPLLKQLEVTGLRITENEAKKVFLTFVLVNHAPSALDNIKGKVTVKTKEGIVGSVDFSVATVAANGTIDVTQPLSTTLRVYELPDWQFLMADVELVD